MLTKIENNIIHFCGNPAGYIKGKTAIVDGMFCRGELLNYLTENGYTIEPKDGVFEKLCLNRHYYETESDTPLKQVRVWQLRSDFDVECRFRSYEVMTQKHGSPDLGNYLCKFDGDLHTNDPEEIFSICNKKTLPDGYIGNPMSISDIVELYDEDSEFYYVDTYGFKKIDI